MMTKILFTVIAVSILALSIWGGGCIYRLQEQQEKQREEYCIGFTAQANKLYKEALQDTGNVTSRIKSAEALQYIKTARYLSENLGYGACLEPVFTKSLESFVNPQQQQIVQGKESHAVAGAAVGGLAGYLLIGGPLGVLAGAAVGAAAGD